MAIMSAYQELAFHEGERRMMHAMGAPVRENPSSPGITPQLAFHLANAPLMAIGTVDEQGAPWTTLWGGEQGMARALGGSVAGIRTVVAQQHDPVVETLVGRKTSGTIVREEGIGRMVSGLTIDLSTRKRVKMFGRMIAGALGIRETQEPAREAASEAEIQLVLKIEESLGNCPKYLNRKQLTPARSNPVLVSDSPVLSSHALALLAKADCFFVSSVQHDQNMDTNYRGGPSGFVRIVSNTGDGTVLCWPEYSGNRLYQTLGNISLCPQIGICVPDFEKGDMLYCTGSAEVLVSKDAAALLPRSNLCVRLTVSAARYVREALSFRGLAGEPSPYNPRVRHLVSEKQVAQSHDLRPHRIVLLGQSELTPSISRFRFSFENDDTYEAGQYVTLDFSEHLDIGYSHMRDDDPSSLNDDFVRTFTVSSPPRLDRSVQQANGGGEFEVTVRKVGVVTEYLFRHGLPNSRNKLEVDCKGFGGDFQVRQMEHETICFIAAGVGITPLLPALESLNLSRLRLLWTVRLEDIGLVQDTLRLHPAVSQCLVLFITNCPSGGGTDARVTAVEEKGTAVQFRRMGPKDAELGAEVSRCYVCTAVPFRKLLVEWIPKHVEVVFEDFNF
jgi:ferredoxin-NADP reductase